ncbi:TatD-related deoxyribonuclease [Paenibacillus baekrokdamisoli]|uniref:TatD-related deoxyribonuclease n=1 Tax=Paenibacillus baekrokdamisoli TaxID=1712516 RepID=A0A3G9IRA8_9BACL|nr:TatD family hydrolase [Paenibacillus baekrokdamisoli]MBB3069711.1 TatD DNase family protein [Paenibacillus baekrokdamisoli]BBH20936.1 TatD-related deoxyribonuclease [Paenibacillus baekrokdamisoli]
MNKAKKMGKWMDAHIHLDLYAEEERDALLHEAFADGGIAAVVAVSMHLHSSQTNRTLAARYPGQVLPAYGFHPEQPLPDQEELNTLLLWIRERFADKESFAIGEVGLPYYSRIEAEAEGRSFDEGAYIVLLETFVALAAELDRPIILHAVYEDADKACDLLEQYGVRRAHFHWFKGSDSVIDRMIKAGYSISITPDVAYEEEIRRLVQKYPIELMMTETDGPWPFEGPFQGQATKPAMVQEVAATIALLKGISITEAEEKLLMNAMNFYK